MCVYAEGKYVSYMFPSYSFPRDRTLAHNVKKIYTQNEKEKIEKLVIHYNVHKVS